MGGSDADDNIIELSVAEHAEAHKKLFEENGNKFDYIAWKTLSKQITFDEATHAAIIEGARRGRLNRKGKYTGKDNHFYGKKHTEESKKKMSDAQVNRGIYRGEDNHFYGKKHSEESKKKMSGARKKQGNFRLGTKHSEETKRRISEGVKRRLHRKDSDLHPSALAY